MMSWGRWSSALQSADWAVPRISLMVPESSLAKHQCCICQAMFTISSKVMFLLCLMFLCSLSLDGSSKALMLRFEAEASPLSGPVCSEWSASLILRPFQSPVPLARSSPTFLGDRTRAPILGARADVAPTCPLVHLRYMTHLVGVGLRGHGGGSGYWLSADSGQPKKVAPWPPLSQKRKIKSFF